MTQTEKPLLIFDGDCHFCRRLAAGWKLVTRDRVDYAPFQKVGDRYPGISKERFDASVQLVLPNGDVIEGAQAVFRALAFAPRWGRWFWLYRKAPGFAPLTEKVYAWVARRRSYFSRFSRAWWGDDLAPPEYFLTRRIFLACLSAIYAIAFVSLGVQIIGLIGQSGISPAAEYLEIVRRNTDGWRFFDFPTVFWMSADNGTLQSVAAIGAAVAVWSIFSRVRVWVFVLLWVLYLSAVTVGENFLMFQWDSLLLETGFLAIFLCPFQRSSADSPGKEPRPPVIVVWLLRWLLFRLMFLSGVVKLASGDPAWSGLKALAFHFETQPLPTWIGWFAHQAPAWVLTLAVVLVFVVELGVPWLILGPRRVRIAAFWVFAGFQGVIMLTGNYCFFNLLAITLGLTLLDDRFFREAAGRLRFWTKAKPKGYPASLRNPALEPWIKTPLLAGLTAGVVLVSGLQFVRLAAPGLALPAPVTWTARAAASWHLVNNYGLFAVMTTTRPEIVLQGSADGVLWREYGFGWKPGELDRAPGFVAPHQPRLDWQMWFAALGDFRRNAWVLRLMNRLLEGAPEVENLFDHNPFPDQPPKYMRALVYDYKFTAAATREKTGAWWEREYRGQYAPYLKLPHVSWPAKGFSSLPKKSVGNAALSGQRKVDPLA
ncbi:MAG: lipase maturation factor family protein [Nitrospinaceae bacterium]